MTQNTAPSQSHSKVSSTRRKHKPRSYAIKANRTKRFTVMFVSPRKENKNKQVTSTFRNLWNKPRLQFHDFTCNNFGKMRSSCLFLAQIERGLCRCHPHPIGIPKQWRIQGTERWETVRGGKIKRVGAQSSQHTLDHKMANIHTQIIHPSTD